MELENAKEQSYIELANAIRPENPVMDKTLVEQRLSKIKQQKYQYYDGNSRVIGSPYKLAGVKNPKFTSPNLTSNAVFYEHSPNLGLSKEDMYKTTANLSHSNSMDNLRGIRKQVHSKQNVPSRLVRQNNVNVKNMTTLDIDIGKNINDIYRNRLMNRWNSAAPLRSQAVENLSENGSQKKSEFSINANRPQSAQKYQEEQRRLDRPAIEAVRPNAPINPTKLYEYNKAAAQRLPPKPPMMKRNGYGSAHKTHRVDDHYQQEVDEFETTQKPRQYVGNVPLSMNNTSKFETFKIYFSVTW